MTLRIIVLFLFSEFCSGQSDISPKLLYEINARLDTSFHKISVSATVKIPQDLNIPQDTVWFHLWANAYSNSQNSFTNEQLKRGSTSFYFRNEKEFSKIEAIKVLVMGRESEFVYKDIGKEMIGVILSDKSSFDGVITFNFDLKLPKLIDGLGYEEGDYYLRNFYPKLVFYNGKKWQIAPHKQFADEWGYNSDIILSLELPGIYKLYSNGIIKIEDKVNRIVGSNIKDLTVVLFDDVKNELSGFITFPDGSNIPYSLVLLEETKFEWSSTDSLIQQIAGSLYNYLGKYPFTSLTILVGKGCYACFKSDGIVQIEIKGDKSLKNLYFGILQMNGSMVALWLMPISIHG
ncbi:MAG: hypothetical protein IPO92_21235 [Saprospiraceae bacterium]|nr:hypothetical protein [Saprospiraceae bacterium]